MEDPKVSVVIPVYNGSNYLREAIDSALRQTYGNIEIIVVNDGSTDDGTTEKVARSFGNRIRYLIKENGGVASALNVGIKEMTGEYFAWLSHDDLFAENRMEEDISFIRQNPGTLITFCKVKTIDGNGSLGEEINIPLNMVSNPFECFKLGGVDMCSMTIHKSCFEKVGDFSISNRTMQDVEMTLRLSTNFTFLHNPNTYFCKRIHTQMGTVTLKDQHKKDQAALFDLLSERFDLSDFFPGIDIRQSNTVYEAYIKLGKLFAAWESFDHADEYFMQAYKTKRRFFSFPSLMRIAGSRFFNETLGKNSQTILIRKILRRVFK